MNVQFDPKSLVEMSGSMAQDCDGNIEMRNKEDFDIKFKFRMTHTEFLEATPRMGTLSAKSTKRIKVKYRKNDVLPLRPRSQKIQVHLLSLKDIKDKENVFVENEEKTEKRTFSLVFHTDFDFDDDEFKSPQASKSVVQDNFSENLADRIPWMKKK